MQNFIEVIKPAADLSLITLYEAKNALALTDEANDDLLTFIITRASDEVARYCNRVFAQETVVETILETVDSQKVLLERYPVKEIIKVMCSGVEIFPNEYRLDKITGKMLGDSFTFPMEVTYTGGYDLPFEAPPALRQAVVLAAREAYFAALRGDATVRMVGHKESRVIYFDPNAALKAVSGGSGGGGSAATRSMKALLERFTRWEV